MTYHSVQKSPLVHWKVGETKHSLSVELSNICTITRNNSTRWFVLQLYIELITSKQAMEI